MRREGLWSLILIDALGGCALLGCLGALAWMFFSRSDNLQTQIATLHASIQTSKQTMAVHQGVRDRQRAVLQTHKAELESRGRLPEHAPIEEYFQVLSGLALHHRLQVLAHTPLDHRSYPGLMEQCYAFEVAGSTPDLMRFLRAMEETPFWADVSHLKITEGARAGTEGGMRRVAALTISVFSAVPAETAPKPKDG